MRAMKYTLVVIGLVTTNTVFAETTTLAFNSSPLMPGSRVVAGDLSKNEFFITGSDNRSAIKTLAQEDHQQPLPVSEAPVMLAPKIKVATNKPVERTILENKPFMPKIKIALNKTFKPIAVEAEKPHQPIIHAQPAVRTALNQSHHNISHEKLPKLHLSNKVIKPEQHKVISHKAHFYSFKQPIHKSHAKGITTRVATKQKAALPKPATHHFSHKSFAQVKVQEHQYKFVSLTAKRHTMHIKTALHGKHQMKKVAVAKI